MNNDKENENVQDQENNNEVENKENENVGTQANENKDEENSSNGSKTFSQDEVNALLKKEKEKANKKMPDSKQYKAFLDWQESQKTEAEKNAEKETKYQKALSDIEEKDNYIAVLESGVSKEDSDYVLFKVSKMDGDFKDNLEDYLKEHPQYLKASQTTDTNEKQTTGSSVQKGATNTSSGVDDILRKKHPDLFK